MNLNFVHCQLLRFLLTMCTCDTCDQHGYKVPVDIFIPSPNSLCAMRDTIYRSLMSDLRMQSVPRASISSVVQVTRVTRVTAPVDPAAGPAF